MSVPLSLFIFAFIYFYLLFRQDLLYFISSSILFISVYLSVLCLDDDHWDGAMMMSPGLLLTWLWPYYIACSGLSSTFPAPLQMTTISAYRLFILFAPRLSGFIVADTLFPFIYLVYLFIAYLPVFIYFTIYLFSLMS
jgi:hypothetical protein